MPLDLAQLLSQIKGLVADLRVGQRERERRLALAQKVLRSHEIEPLKRKIAASNTTWLVAGIVEGLSQHYEAPPCPEEFTVIASDGSHIDVDRHSSVPCYLINIGTALLQYGESPDALLASEPALFFGQDLVIADASGNREEFIEGALLGVKRSVEECGAVARLAQELPPERPALALLDGSLILWGLAGRDFEEAKSYVREELLERSYLGALDSMKRLSQGGELALASYISFPRSTDVVNALRVALCPHDPADCDLYCSTRRDRDCDGVGGIQDGELFGTLLGDGERSPVFVSGSRFMRKHYGEHQIHFFYLKVDEEVARVEIPAWVVERGLVGLVHALTLDQCKRGHGYPVALMEAHEKAVVTNADRERFWELIETSLWEERLPLRSSGKRKSKRTRWV